jgi:hypothetical protein
MGGGLIRSLDGREAFKKTDRRERIKGDQRILGESDFVSEVLEQANESMRGTMS